METIDTSDTQEGSAFARFMASGKGRVARVGLGSALILAGTLAIPAPVGLAVATFGLVPIATGVFNLCPVAPAWGGHFIGARYCERRTPRTDSHK